MKREKQVEERVRERWKSMSEERREREDKVEERESKTVREMDRESE